jgi:nucleoside-diphosphate-sugar epimerase
MDPEERVDRSADPRGPVVLVTGGAGFLGRALLGELARPAATRVLRPRELRVLDQRPRPADYTGVTYLQGDVRSAADLARACAGVDVVLHLAAVIDWGQHPADLVHAVNVEGTRVVVAACRAAGVRALVFVSSLDAVYAGRPVHDADETLPYPAEFPTAYCASKAAAERLVLAADGAALAPGGALRTLVLRPCAIWGERDPYHLDPVLALARRGPVVRLGRDPAPSQFVYVGNMAHAVLVGAGALLDGRAGAAGQVFFITDFPARSFFDHLEPVIRAAGGRVLPQALALPHAPLRLLARVAVLAVRWLRPIVRLTPFLTPFSVDYICQEFTVRSDRAARVLGYRPVYSEEEAYARTIAALD